MRKTVGQWIGEQELKAQPAVRVNFWSVFWPVMSGVLMAVLLIVVAALAAMTFFLDQAAGELPDSAGPVPIPAVRAIGGR
jgi:hypothetical protein